MVPKRNDNLIPRHPDTEKNVLYVCSNTYLSLEHKKITTASYSSLRNMS